MDAPLLMYTVACQAGGAPCFPATSRVVMRVKNVRAMKGTQKDMHFWEIPYLAPITWGKAIQSVLSFCVSVCPCGFLRSFWSITWTPRKCCFAREGA